MKDDALAMRRPADPMTRRAVLGGAVAITAAAASERWARAAGEASLPPVVFLGHGSPRLPIDPVRSGELRAWGATLPKVNAIVVMTPHFGSRHIELGATGPGFGMYNMPRWMKRQLPQDLDYHSPPSGALAASVEALLRGAEPVARADRRGFDHTTWMPLSFLYPSAGAPVLEISYPYRTDAELFALGQRLAPLRRDGALFVASGQLTHNLAAVAFGPDADAPSTVPAWSKDFDAWAADALARRDVDAIVDFRRKAPAAELAHPDDGGHFRVMIFALGVLAGSGGPASPAAFPVVGFESSMSKRGVELR